MRELTQKHSLSVAFENESLKDFGSKIIESEIKTKVFVINVWQYQTNALFLSQIKEI